ncbi:TIM barrel protein [Rhizobium sp. BR 315]|uniref:TIM barrel protein n=1 Tax=Rhizobium sp. BR 315 TaxID=3040014 RepID=UPI003D332A57
MDTLPVKMTLGIQPTGWTNDDFQEIGNDIPYQTILEQTKEAGFDGGSTGHNYPTHAPSLSKAMQLSNLKIAATWDGTTFTTGIEIEEAFSAFQAQVAFLKSVGAQDVVVAELANAVNQVRTKSVLTDRPIFNEPQWYLLTSLLDRAGKYAHEQGMQLSYHPHVGTGVMTIKETIRLMESTNPIYVGLCLDTGHLHYGGAVNYKDYGDAQDYRRASQSEIEDLTERYASRIKHVHLKNVRRNVLPLAVDNKFSFYQAIMQGIFTVPGDPDGDLDLRPILRILKGAGYNRWMIIEAEQDPTKANPLQCAKTARAFLREELGW